MNNNNQHLKVSVVICTYNRDKFIGTVLICLAAQTLSKNEYEIVIVDNNSTDETAEISKNFIQNYPEVNARYVLETNRGLSFARNRGIAEAQSPVITYLDDDAEPVPGYLNEIVSFFETHPDAMGAGGKVIPKYAEGKEPDWMNKYLYGFVGYTDFGEHTKQFDKAMKYPTGCNMTYKKALLEQSGGFNNQLTFRSDDKHIFYEVSKLTDKIFYLPKALVYHNIDDERLQFSSFKKLFLKTGNEEKIRVRTEQGQTGVIKKLAEYCFKLGASVFLYIIFLLKNQERKGRFVFYSQWFTLKGFLSKRVFVR